MNCYGTATLSTPPSRFHPDPFQEQPPFQL
jgi:hypothetical protein